MCFLRDIVHYMRVFFHEGSALSTKKKKKATSPVHLCFTFQTPSDPNASLLFYCRSLGRQIHVPFRDKFVFHFQ